MPRRVRRSARNVLRVAPYALILPFFASCSPAYHDRPVVEWLGAIFLGGFFAVWLFSFGGAIGSFLNVVAYRLPRGLGLSRPASFCPICRVPIAWHDNLPVLGWLKLGGHCRACSAPISVRYPLVEAAVGATWLILATLELWFGGVNLPDRIQPAQRGILGMSFHLPRDLVETYVFHSLGASWIWAWVLIRFDRQKVPAKAIFLALVAFLGAVIVRPALISDHLERIWSFEGSAPGWLRGATAGLVGLAIGWLIGLAIGTLGHSRERRSETREANQESTDPATTRGYRIEWLLATLGVLLGMRGAIAIGVAGFVLLATRAILTRNSRRAGLEPECWIAAMAFVYLTCWRWY